MLALKRSVVAHYAARAQQAYDNAVEGARHLAKAVESFVERPSASALISAREAWLSARVPFLHTEAFRFYDGPIDALDGMINAWPVDESYIDYVADNPGAGVINQPQEFSPLSEALILSLNEKEGEKNISTGFHAIEFLLWGQDFATNGPGNRSWADYTDGKPHADRRREYLRVVTRLLVRHLETISAAWSSSDPTNYRAAFVTAEPDESLAKILKGLGTLSGPELAGERLTVPYETKDQEDEHSCFSDNTHNDIIHDALGIQMAYLGRDLPSNPGVPGGPGIHDLLLRVAPDLAGALAAGMERSVALARLIPPPFDQAIQGPTGSKGRRAIQETISSLLEQSALIARAAKALGAKLELEPIRKGLAGGEPK